jgi:hypothetical protein
VVNWFGQLPGRSGSPKWTEMAPSIDTLDSQQETVEHWSHYRTLLHNVPTFWPQDTTSRSLTKTVKKETGYVDDSNTAECDSSRRSCGPKLWRRTASNSTVLLSFLKKKKKKMKHCMRLKLQPTKSMTHDRLGTKDEWGLWSLLISLLFCSFIKSIKDLRS